MSRVLLSFATVAILFLSTSAAHGQKTVCPKKEIIIFGSSYAYSTVVCSKDGENCSEEKSAAILFYPQKVTKLGHKDAPDCNECKTAQAAMTPPKGALKNYVYRGRQIFVDTTNGISKLKSLGFARVTGDKSDTYFAVFEIRVAYTIDEKTEYYMSPVALQLIGNPGIPEISEATQKTENNQSVLEVTNAETKETMSYNIVVEAGAHGAVMQPLSAFTDKDPMPETAKEKAEKMNNKAGKMEGDKAEEEKMDSNKPGPDEGKK